MTLRLRLLLVLVGIVTVGLVVADVATYASLRSYLFSQVDNQLQSEVSPATQAVICLTEPFCARRTPGVIPPVGTWVQVRDQSGTIIGGTNPSFDPLPAPNLPDQLPGVGTANGSSSDLFDVDGSSNGTTVGYRVFVATTTVNDVPYIGVVAIPLNDLHHTLGRLLLIELLVTVVVVVGLGAVAWWLVRRGLRPLDAMTATAGAIAAGDLSRRVEDTDERTEVGQLGTALNTMLTGIEGAFSARAASEERLRRFLADASHELRTPLTSIRGYSELFDRGARDRPEDLATSMRHIREEASRMSVLVDDLLLLARLDHERPVALEHVDLSAVVGAAVDAIRLRAPGRAISYQAPGPVVVLGDADRLRQVIDNLLTNAEHHTPGDSPIDVRVSTEEATACLEVSDRGPGIPVDEQAEIFEPFHRADPTRARATGGVGLGLSIVSAISHAHGGTVGVVSDPTSDNGRRGATFWVRIPLAGAIPDHADDVAPAVERAPAVAPTATCEPVGGPAGSAGGPAESAEPVER